MGVPLNKPLLRNYVCIDGVAYAEICITTGATNKIIYRTRGMDIVNIDYVEDAFNDFDEFVATVPLVAETAYVVVTQHSLRQLYNNMKARIDNYIEAWL